jgi:hypothetical protein
MNDCLKFIKECKEMSKGYSGIYRDNFELQQFKIQHFNYKPYRDFAKMIRIEDIKRQRFIFR